MSKLRASTFFCAFSIARVTMRCSIASPSCEAERAPSSRCDALRRRRCAAGRPRATGRSGDEPGSPWRPERPRSWLSMRRLSWRSVPTMCSPPAATTSSRSAAHCGLEAREQRRGYSGCSLVVLPHFASARNSGIAAEHDVGAAAGHVGRDRDGALAARLRDDLGLALVLLGVQHVVLDAALA